MPDFYSNQIVGPPSMQAPKRNQFSNGSQQSYYQQIQHNSMHAREVDFYSSPQSFQPSDQRCSTDGSQLMNFPQQYCTLESSGSASCNSFSSASGSPLSQHDYQPENNGGSPVSGSCITQDQNDLKHKLRELETAMLGPESDIAGNFESSFQYNFSSEPEKSRLLMEISQGDLRQTLIACAGAVGENNMVLADLLIGELRQMVSVSGEPLQRLGAYLLEGLVARISSSGSSIYKSLRCKEPTSSELLSYMGILYEVCPYFKFGYMSANGAIAEAVRGADKVHIIDFQIAMGTQWVTLIHALAARPGGSPSLRITGIDDPVSEFARGGGLHIVGQRLTRLAESCNVPFEFHAAAISGCEVEIEHLGVRPGEALAVNFAYMLHHMPDESVSTKNHRDRLLRMVRSLSPTVVTLVEQESNTNTAPFLSRFVETLDYYTAMFESIDATPLARENKERISVEQHCLARDIVNIIACEGAERIERHELLGKWRSRFTMAGFKPCPLSPLVNDTIRSLLRSYHENYRLEERDGTIYLGWKNRTLVVSCAWR